MKRLQPISSAARTVHLLPPRRWIRALSLLAMLTTLGAFRPAAQASGHRHRHFDPHPARVSGDSSSELNPTHARVHVGLDGEIGAITPLFHVVQFSRDGSRIDYRRDAGQDNLFFYSRWAAQLRIDDRHTVRLLYQPLDIRTNERPDRTLSIDGANFPADRPIDFRYGFSFYRAGYFFDLARSPATELSIGLAGQIRNASIEFVATDGSVSRSNRDIGFVPLLGFRAEHHLPERWWFGGEAVGFYAPIKYLNGGRSDVEGAIADIAVRAGLRHPHGIRSSLGLRYIGGGATGTERSPRPPGDGYVKNWIHTLVLAVGFHVR